MSKREMKELEVVVKVRIPKWLSPKAARREIRALVNEQTFYGHRRAGSFDEIGEGNFRAVAVRAKGRGE